MEDNLSKIEKYYIFIKQKDINEYSAQQITKLQNMLSSKPRIDTTRDIQLIHQQLLKASQKNIQELKKTLNLTKKDKPQSRIFANFSFKTDQQKIIKEQNKRQIHSHSFKQDELRSDSSFDSYDEQQEEDQNKKNHQNKQKKPKPELQQNLLFVDNLQENDGEFKILLEVHDLNNPDSQEFDNENFLIDTMRNQSFISQKITKSLNAKSQTIKIKIGSQDQDKYMIHQFKVAKKGQGSSLGRSFFKQAKLEVIVNYYNNEIKIKDHVQKQKQK